MSFGINITKVIDKYNFSKLIIMVKFKKTINGTVREFIHHSRHKANSRSVALVKHLEYLRENDLSDSQNIINSFKAGYNMGYDEARKRTNKNWEIKNEYNL